MLQGRRIVVTGGAGFIGSHLTERLAAHNEVVVLDDVSVGKLANLGHLQDRVRVVKGSILDMRAVKRAMDGASVVFHLAALTSPTESMEQPLAYAEANVMGTINILTAAREAGAQRVVFASTCAIYGRSPGPLREDLQPDPISPYAVTKLACEYFCRTLAGEGLEAVSLRLFNVYGPRQSPESPYASVVAKFCEAVRLRKKATLYGDGTQTRDFVFVSDVAEAFERAAEASGVGGEVINVGSGASTSIRELIRLIGDIRGRTLEFVPRSPRPGDILQSLADPTRARRLLGFEPRTSLKEGLRQTLTAFGALA
ncbi:MAG TPA: NAD-dependent epimerase/dehydratase family protein [Thermoplasmata archaeon]|nr:NAD-dependent epimerase/dehydratase family protein [Thermoplasmata archaeon]